MAQLNSNNIQYLGNHAERIDSLKQLQEGEIYVVGRGADAFRAFIMPGEGYVLGNTKDSFLIRGIPIYEAVLADCGKKIDHDKVENPSDIHIDQDIDVEMCGVFRPTKGSKLREILEEKLLIDDSKSQTESQ